MAAVTTARTLVQGAQYAARMYSSGPQPRRVVVTGIGAVTPLGKNLSLMWHRLLDGETAVSHLRNPESYKDIPVRIGAEVNRDAESEDGFGLQDWHEGSMRKQLPDSIQFALAAAREALQDAKWTPKTEEEQDRAGVAIGTGISGLQDLLVAEKDFQERGYRRVSPYLIPNSLVNMAAGLVSIQHGLRGPNHAVSTACATGAHAVGDAFRFIKHGDADVMVCGGTDACIMPVTLAGFARAKALASSYNDNPGEASRPFDKARSGFVMGEGAGVLVLEDLDHALRRGARIYAEVRGYGLSGDAYHITAPSESGSGAIRAMRSALREGGLGPSDVDYINAHATSTPLGDAIENTAIKAVFGDHARNLAISSTKGALGHLLGAAGAVEAVITVLSIMQQIAPPTCNLTHPSVEEGFDLNYVPLTAQARRIRAAITNSFGFGGTNACLAFSQYKP